METERNILDHIRVLVRWRRLIFVSCFLVVSATVAISLVLPKAYRAYAMVYPPRDAQSALGLGALLGDLRGSLLGGLGDDGISATEFVPVLQSERVRLSVAERFNLFERYNASHRTALLDKIGLLLKVELSREQFLSISYEADTPELAAEITNAFVEELEQALQARNRQQTGRYLEYLERRLREAEAEMFEAERRYNQFQEKNMAIDIESQAKAQIESASKLIGSLVDLIVKRDIAAQMMAANNPQLKQLELEIRTTTQALDHLLMGALTETEGATHPLPGIFKPFREIPQLGLTALQLMRDVEIQNAIYQFVKKEYEKTRFERERETAMVIVLDRAVPPDARSSPRRTMMVLIAGGLSLALSGMLAFLFEAFGNLSPENRARIDAIANDLRNRV